MFATETSGIVGITKRTIRSVEVTVLGQTFRYGDERLSGVSISFGANERSSSIQITIVDPDLLISDKFYIWSKANGGIKLPPELAEQTNSGTDVGVDPTPTTGGSVALDKIPNGLKDDELAKVIIAYCKEKASVIQLEQISYILATCQHESSMGLYTSEIGGESASYAPWYGRGLVQLTHKDNYIKAAEELGLASDIFTNDPDLVSDLQYAIPILVDGMKDGWFTGVGLADYIVPGSVDYVGARAIVNGSDRADLIAGYAETWATRVTELGYSYNPVSDRVEVEPRKNSNKSKPIPGFVTNPFPRQDFYVNDPRIPSVEEMEQKEDIRTSPQPGQEGQVLNPEPDSAAVEITPIAQTVGEKITLKVETETSKYTYTFILTDTGVGNLPLGILTVSGKAVRQELAISDKTQNFEDITPQEYFGILSRATGIKIRDKTKYGSRPKIRYIEQQKETDLRTALSIASDTEIDVIDDVGENAIEIKESIAVSKNLIISDIISLDFADNGVTDELPLYPVNVQSLISDSILQLHPRDSIALDNVYTFIPDSLKKGNWVINTLSLDLVNDVAAIALLKYIPKPQAAGTGIGGGGVLDESAILSKYETAVVKVGSDKGYASGAFISADGYILTAAHMKGQTGITTKDGTKYTATQVDINESVDIMLYKVEATGVNFIPIAPDLSIYENKTDTWICKIGHGWSSETGGEGGKTPKDWDITSSTVIDVLTSFKDLNGQVIHADDKNVDFVNPGDSGCPWMDKWGLVVSCTSGGDRSHEEGAGKKDAAWGGGVDYIIKMLDKNGVKYTKGSRESAPIAGSVDEGGGITTGGINEKIIASLNKLGEFSTSDFHSPNVACAYAVNNVIKNAGFAAVGSNSEYVPSVREALMGGRGSKVSRSEVTGGTIVIANGCYHIGIARSSSEVRSTSSSAQCFCWNSDLDLDGYYDGMSVDGYNAGTEFWNLIS